MFINAGFRLRQQSSCGEPDPTQKADGLDFLGGEQRILMWRLARDRNLKESDLLVALDRRHNRTVINHQRRYSRLVLAMQDLADRFVSPQWNRCVHSGEDLSITNDLPLCKQRFRLKIIESNTQETQ